MQPKPIEFNKVFAFFLNNRGVASPKFKKTPYGYRTYDSRWKLYKAIKAIVFSKPTKVYNGYDYDDAIEETRFKIVQKPDKISMIFEYTKII